MVCLNIIHSFIPSFIHLFIHSFNSLLIQWICCAVSAKSFMCWYARQTNNINVGRAYTHSRKVRNSNTQLSLLRVNCLATMPFSHFLSVIVICVVQLIYTQSITWGHFPSALIIYIFGVGESHVTVISSSTACSGNRSIHSTVSEGFFFFSCESCNWLRLNIFAPQPTLVWFMLTIVPWNSLLNLCQKQTWIFLVISGGCPKV